MRTLPAAVGRESTGPPAVDPTGASTTSAIATAGCYHSPMSVLSRRPAWLATAALLLLLPPAGPRIAIAQTGVT